MKIDETIKMAYPHNLPCGEQYFNKIKKLINTANELGGTVYEVAADAGLLSAWHFLELWFDDVVTEEKILPEDMTIVTEVYVRYPELDELERIFLYSDNAVRDHKLVEEGQIQGGKLIIDYDRLRDLHERGYSCIYQRAEGVNKGITSNRFKDVFGKEQRRIFFKPWDEDYHFIGNGFNQALFMRTVFETVLVMPDIHAVKESIRAVHAEQLVRTEYDATFSLERIELDAHVISELENIRFDLFGRAKMKEYKELRNSYRKLTCQIAYLKVHYPKVYETVWNDDFEADDEKTNINWDETETATLGICLNDYDTSYAICRMKDGRIKRVPNIESPRNIPLVQKYRFKGYGDILNAGVAGSRIALIMKQMITSAEMMFGVSIKKVYVTHIGRLPKSEEIIAAMEEKKERAKKKGNENGSVDLIAYQEIADKNIDGLGILKWAAELAKLPQMEYIDSLTAIMTAFEKFEQTNSLKPQQIGLIYDFSKRSIAITLVRKRADASLEVIMQQEEMSPELSIYDKHELEEDEYNPNLEYVLGSAIDAFMMNAGLRALGIYGENERDEEAFSELRSSVPMVKRQFRRNDVAKIIFDNGYLNMLENYPIENFEECFRPILERNKWFLCNVIADAGISMSDIAKVYLVGEECEYPFVRKSVEDITKQKACCIYPFECVAARGTALS